nr:MAG TPA: hypothetical protein [Caudoviricetes sp.]
MGRINCTIELEPKYNIKAKLPRKLKKDIIKVAGREAYKEIISKMEHYYSIFGYKKFSIKRI